jgi:hypothetical protein
MIRWLIIAATTLSLLSLSTSAWAQDEEGGESAEARKVQYASKTEIDFAGLDVAGELVKPSGSLIGERKRANFNPLIRLRTDFNAEMAESVDEIK